MADSKSDLAIRGSKASLDAKMRRFVKKYEKLNNSIYILSNNRLKLKKVLAEYTRDLQQIWLPFFAGKNVEKLAKKAHKDFIDELNKYVTRPNINKRFGESSTLLTALRGQIIGNFNGVINQNRSLLSTKFNLFKSLAEASKIPAEKFADIQLGARVVTSQTLADAGSLGATAAEREAVQKAFIEDFKKTDIWTIKGKSFDKNIVNSTWKQLSKTYGMSDTVQYRDGRNHPIRSYTDLKYANMSREITNATTLIDSQANGITTVKVSKHGSRDSCILSEGEILFINQTSKDLYIRNFPDDKAAKRFRTVQQATDDKSHIFKANCKHRTLPFMLQHFDEADRQKTVEENEVADLSGFTTEHQFLKENDNAA